MQRNVPLVLIQVIQFDLEPGTDFAPVHLVYQTVLVIGFVSSFQNHLFDFEIVIDAEC